VLNDGKERAIGKNDLRYYFGKSLPKKINENLKTSKTKLSKAKE